MTRNFNQPAQTASNFLNTFVRTNAASIDSIIIWIDAKSSSKNGVSHYSVITRNKR